MSLSFSSPTWNNCTPRQWQALAFRLVSEYYAQNNLGVISAIMGAGKSFLIKELCACAALKENEVVVVSTSTEHLVEDLYHEIQSRCHLSRRVGLWYGREKKAGQIIVVCIPSMESLAQKLREAGKSVLLWIADEAHRSECESVIRAQALLKPVHSLGLTATAFRADDAETIRLFKSLIYSYGVSDAQNDKVVVPWRIVNHNGGMAELDKVCADFISQASGPGMVNASCIEDAVEFAKLLGPAAKAIHSKQSPQHRRKVLVDLKNGLIRCIVHVNLLAEGANYPWLRWLVLRREVESRVRFIQEIGRILRSHPGKSEAVFYDPHDLFGSFSLSYAEALGELPPKEDAVFKGPIETGTKIMESDPPVAMAWIESTIRALVVACDAARMLKNRKIVPKAARLVPVTPFQQAAMRLHVERCHALAPTGWQVCLKSIAERCNLLRFGFASDLICALSGISEHKRWPFVNSDGRAGQDTEGWGKARPG